jgi:hypothetical protein
MQIGEIYSHKPPFCPGLSFYIHLLFIVLEKEKNYPGLLSFYSAGLLQLLYF